jgi:hypothetical protein
LECRDHQANFQDKWVSGPCPPWVFPACWVAMGSNGLTIRLTLDHPPRTTFGTRGSQVQILPLRPAFSIKRIATGPDMGNETPCHCLVSVATRAVSQKSQAPNTHFEIKGLLPRRREPGFIQSFHSSNELLTTPVRRSACFVVWARPSSLFHDALIWLLSYPNLVPQALTPQRAQHSACGFRE